jgi:glucosamine 6-phosphate synthetase-like amidotransferase/phosphosugar isomerase protein
VCGIAGYSLSSDSGVDRTLAAQALLAAIAERGSDAVGYAYRNGDAPVAIHKQRTGASELLDAVTIPSEASQVLLHVRDYTKGHPSLAANNHPIRHGSVVGIHNGIIANDEEIFERHGFERAEPGMTVDSEAIFALVESARNKRATLDELYGSMATAWLEDRTPGMLFLARGVGRPLWIGEGRSELLFASTHEALELAERYADLRVRKRELPEGSLVTVAEGRVLRTETFHPDRSFAEEPLPPVRAPEERRSALRRLAAIAAPAQAG